jgi:membrane fusion protein, multidrug efflux system
MTEQNPNLLIERTILAPQTGVEAVRGPRSGTTLDLRAEPVSPVQAGGEKLPAVRQAARAPRAEGHRLRKLLLIGASLFALAGAGYLGWEYWTVGRFLVSTDDAYVKADSTTIAPKVSGYIAEVLIDDNQQVRAGQVLTRIDDRDFRVALNQADADLEAAKAAVATKQAGLTAQQSVIEAAQATIAVDQANVVFAEQDDKRYSQLASTGNGSVQNAQQATSRLAAGRASVARDRASLENAAKQLDVLKAELSQARATVARDEALRSQAELNLSYTSIMSPVDGVVGNRTLRVGQYVQAGTQLMAVVPLAAAYLVANYKETQLTDVRPGQPVAISVDMFPGVTFNGHVDSIAPASGQEFALLPPDNATGNFTKVVQRIPVKIVLDPGSKFAGELRPGMSVYPTIETKPRDLRTASASVRKG